MNRKKLLRVILYLFIPLAILMCGCSRASIRLDDGLEWVDEGYGMSSVSLCGKTIIGPGNISLYKETNLIFGYYEVGVGGAVQIKYFYIDCKCEKMQDNLNLTDLQKFGVRNSDINTWFEFISLHGEFKKEGELVRFHHVFR